MTTDIRLDHPHDNWLTVEGNILRVETADIMLDHQPRRKAVGGYRRALVHDFNDGLTINWNDDYPGGVTIRGKTDFPGSVRVHLHDYKAIEAYEAAPRIPGVLSLPPLAEAVDLGEEIRRLRERLSVLEANVRVK